MRTEKILDGITLITIVLPGVLSIGLSFFCTGWSEGITRGTCSISLLEPLYNSFENTTASLASASFLFFPITISLVYATSTFFKVQVFRRLLSGEKLNIQNLPGLVIWDTATVVILYHVLFMSA